LAVDHHAIARARCARVQTIESDLGRARLPGLTPEARRFTPRTLDIDIIFYGDEVISAPDDLHVPHLLAASAPSCCGPLVDIAPDFTHPTLYRPVRELLAELDDEHEVRRGAYPTDGWLIGWSPDDGRRRLPAPGPGPSRRALQLRMYLSKRPADAEDLVQETYLRAFRFSHRFRREPISAPGCFRF